MTNDYPVPVSGDPKSQTLHLYFLLRWDVLLVLHVFLRGWSGTANLPWCRREVNRSGHKFLVRTIRGEFFYEIIASSGQNYNFSSFPCECDIHLNLLEARDKRVFKCLISWKLNSWLKVLTCRRKKDTHTSIYPERERPQQRWMSQLKYLCYSLHLHTHIITISVLYLLLPQAANYKMTREDTNWLMTMNLIFIGETADLNNSPLAKKRNSTSELRSFSFDSYWKSKKHPHHGLKLLKPSANTATVVK